MSLPSSCLCITYYITTIHFHIIYHTIITIQTIHLSFLSLKLYSTLSLLQPFFIIILTLSLSLSLLFFKPCPHFLLVLFVRLVMLNHRLRIVLSYNTITLFLDINRSFPRFIYKLIRHISKFRTVLSNI